MELDKEILRGYIDPIILSILAREDSYGYEIAKEAKRLSDEAFELKEGTLYVAFKRLEKKRLCHKLLARRAGRQKKILSFNR